MAQKRSLKDTSRDPLAKEAFIQGGDKKLKVVTADNNTKMVNTRLPKGLIKNMKLACVQAEITIQQFVTEAVGEKLKTMNY
jgi:hypothetical protein